MNVFDRMLRGLSLKRIERVNTQAIPPQTPGTLANYFGNNYRPPNYGDIITWQAQDMVGQVQNGYSANDIVYSIVRKIAEKAKKAPWAEYRVKDTQKYAKYIALLKETKSIDNWDKVIELKYQALELVTTPTKVTDLLLRPNSEDTWGDIVEAMISFKLITGNAYMYGKMITAGKNAGLPYSVHVLPSQYMSIVAQTTVFPQEIISYQLFIQTIQSFTKEEIIRDAYFNPNYNISGIQLYGLSPLKAAAKVLTRSNEGKNAAVMAYKNGGPRGVLFVNDDQGVNSQWDPELAAQEATAIRKKLAQGQGTNNYNQAEASGHKLGYIPLGLSPVDLDLLNAENYDLRALCRVYNVPSTLFNDPENTTLDNMKVTMKSLTTDAAIPALCSLRDQVNRKLQRDWNAKGSVVDFDISVYQELQEGKVDQVNWLNKSALPIERWYEVMGEKLPEWMDEETKRTILIPSNMTTLDAIKDPSISLPDNMNAYAQPNQKE